MPLSFLPYLAPLALMAVAAIAVARPGFRPRSSVILAELAAVCAMLVAAGSAIWLGMHGAVTSPLIGVGGVGLAVRIDVVSMVMFGLVSFIGWIVLRYSATYLDGEARQGAFTGWMARHK